MSIAAAPEGHARSEVEVAADTIAALAAARLLIATPAQLALATGVPVAAIRAAFVRRETGRIIPPPSAGPCGAKPRATGRPKTRTIPDDATEWVCRDRRWCRSTTPPARERPMSVCSRFREHGPGV